MADRVASPVSEGSSTTEKKVKVPPVICAVCNVEIPPGPDSLEMHESGKRHARMRAHVDAVEALARRSVFIKISPARAPSPVEMDTDDDCDTARSSTAVAVETPPTHKTRLIKEEIERVMGKFGHIERVLCRAESGHYAIVEYEKDEEAKAALTAHSIEMSCTMVRSDGAEGAVIVPTTILIMERRVNFSAAAPVERHMINVDEIVEALDRLEVNPSGSTDGYTSAIDEVVRHIVLRPEQLVEREALAARLETELSKYFAAPSVRIFGSSITSIGTIDSDIDMCLNLSDSRSSHSRLQFLHQQQQRDKYTLLTGDAAQFRLKKVQAGEMRRLSGPDRVRFVSKILNEVRKENGWMGVQRPIVDCRLPIVRFLVDKEILVDLSVDNTIGAAKSAYIRALIKADASDRLRRMLIGLRFWALSNGLFEAQEKGHKGHFNAYMLNLLAISFLQSSGAIPPFQHSDTPEHGGPSGKYRIDFVVPPYTLESMSVQAFLKAFFIHMTAGVSLRESVIVGRTGEQLSLAAFTQRFPDFTTESAPVKFEFALMNVQDPIELSHNVTTTLNEKYVRRMRHMMMRSLHAMKTNKDSFVSILSIDKRLNRDNVVSPEVSSMMVDETTPSDEGKGTASVRPDTAAEDISADAVLAVCYPRDPPTTMDAMMRASAFVFERILLADEIEQDDSRPISGQAAKKRRRALSDMARERLEACRSTLSINGRSHPAKATVVSATSPPSSQLLFHWGVYALPARLWIGRRNVKRKLQKEHPQAAAIEVESMVSHELFATPPAVTPSSMTSSVNNEAPILIVRIEFAFHVDVMLMRFHRLEGAPLDLVNVLHFLEGNGLMVKYAHSLLPMIAESEGTTVAGQDDRSINGSQSISPGTENTRPGSGKRRLSERAMEID